MKPRRSQIHAVIVPAIVWAVHFIVIYAAASAVCAPRVMLDVTSFWIIAGVVTVLALAAAAYPMVVPPQGAAELRRAGRWSSLIACLAILFGVLPVPFFTACGG